MNIMKLGDYIARIEYDDEIDNFHGQVINLRDVITFYGRTPDELRREFEKSLDTYIEFCQERGVEPKKPFSGRFNIRMQPAQHQRFSEAAEAEGKSLNAWAVEKLEQAIEHRDGT